MAIRRRWGGSLASQELTWACVSLSSCPPAMLSPGNNWGRCPGGGAALGCGPQEEFRACADIAIGRGPGEGPGQGPGQGRDELRSSRPPGHQRNSTTSAKKPWGGHLAARQFTDAPWWRQAFEELPEEMGNKWSSENNKSFSYFWSALRRQEDTSRAVETGAQGGAEKGEAHILGLLLLVVIIGKIVP